MKKIFLFLSIMLVLIACKNEAKTDSDTDSISVKDGNFDIKNNANVSITVNGVTELKGEFIFFDDAAVLQTSTEVYGVVIDSMMHALQDQVKVYKKEVTDMVPVAIKGKITPRAENKDGWPFNIEILEIIEVYEPQPENNTVIKLEKQSK